MKSIDLSGEWKFRKANGGRWMTARVPGDVYTDLFENGEIPDPFVGKNENDVQWVARTDWIYEKEFEAGDDFLNQEKKVLDFRGLDTVAQILLNGREIGRAKNAHRRYEYDVTDMVRRGENVLRVRFRSPVEYGLEQREKYKYNISPPRYPVDQPGREFVRKPQCHFGWDWSPSLPTVGIYRDVELVGFNQPRIQYLKTEQNFHGNDVLLKVRAGLEVPIPGSYEFKTRIGERETSVPMNLPSGRSEVTQEIKIEKPDLWWPAGYGEQALYDLRVSTGNDNQVRSVGFRQFELIREKDSKGESFYFEVNGTPVYVKGANTIPLDALLGRITENRYSRLIDSAVSANMNTLRVWGGGFYEADEFYELCDRKGIMVWQDFGFACSPYPGDKDFLENVRKEVRYQARRLGTHPSLVLWCGDNENEWLGEEGDYDNENISWTEIVKDYEKLNETISQTVQEEDPDRPFWPSSPSSGGKSSPNDQSIGDSHYWDVWHGGKPFSDYLTTKPRFVSEFGYQSFSSKEVLREVVSEEGLNPTAPELEYRQRHPRGNKLIVRRMADNFRFPFSFEDFIYLSQIQQGLAMKIAVEHWRRLKPYCMGTLYWQLNDVWPAISWSSLEYGGGWKALHYFAKRFYSPVLVSTRERENKLEIWLTSDVDREIAGTIRLSAFSLEGKEIGAELIESKIPELTSRKITEFPLEKVLGGTDKDNTILEVSFKSRHFQSNNYHFFVPFKALKLKQPGVSYTLSGDGLIVRSERPALFVKLDLKGGSHSTRFTKNYFHLLPGHKSELEILSNHEEGTSIFEESNIRVKHLRESYN